MDGEIDDILIAAWRRVRETLKNDPAEVRRRLRRGREMFAKRPPRAWCLAVRASDRRISPMTAVCVPEAAAYPRECMAAEMRTSYERHTVTLDVELLRGLCGPVRLHEWGEPIGEVARKVGRRKEGLFVARAVGALSSRYCPQDGGRGGKQMPILASRRELDPSAHLCAAADRVWGWTGRIMPWRVPDEWPAQDIVRVPVYYDRTRPYADKSGLHPEHPLVDRVPSKRPVRRVAPPPPDHVAYKWKGDQFVGYDWRAAETNPRIRANYERRERQRVRQRAYAAAKHASRPSRGGGSSAFAGWMWLCPICGKRKKVLYCPLPPINVLRGYGCRIEDEVVDAAEAELDLRPASRDLWPASDAARGFGCVRCHHVREFSRASPGAWNEAVCYLSGGLLYGKEVPRPAWFTRQRKRRYVPHPTMPLPRRPAQVQALLLEGMTYKQIGAALGIRWQSAGIYASKVYTQHGVHGRYELARKLGRLPPLRSKQSMVVPRARAALF